MYIHYDSKNYNYFFGGKNFKDTFKADFVQGFMYKVATNKKITLYYIDSGYDILTDDHYTILGNLNNEKWVKYLNTRDIAKKYFGSNQTYWFKEIKFSNDTIIISYQLYADHINRNPIERGEFRFKWDDAAQWFSVEQIKY